MTLVAGVDSSTQSCTIVVRDAHTGRLVRSGGAPHPDGTEVDPAAWWDAFRAAAETAGGLTDVAAIAVGGQQHGMVALDVDGAVVRPALLWNDTRSADAATDLIRDLGSQRAWAEAVGSVPVASFTASKLRWLRDHEPDNAARVAAVALPHDWLSWRIAGHGPGDGSGRGRHAAGRASDGGSALDALVTDRSEASGTGYWSPRDGDYRRDLLDLAVGREVQVPRVLEPAESVVARGSEVVADGTVVGAGAGDNAAAALALDMRPGDVTVSIGTSGVVSAVNAAATADPSGKVAGFADATGAYLPLACTLNASRVLDAACELLGIDHDRLAELALAAPPGADGLTLVPYLEGERTPNRPDATGTLHGLRLATTTPEHLARAAVEGMLCGLADALDALRAHDVPVNRLRLIGGGARSEAVRRIAPQVFGLPVEVPEPGEYVADGAARQAAWALSGSATPPAWDAAEPPVVYDGPAEPHIRQRYAEVRDLAP
ncbi:xylulokinase [Haloechinothrix salitolerans]|uniref:Xylulose kinase n=1 Tax=Haloechinothrix salitolerans TaxID=926830 RepID=A0ABW2BX28_9PSEU